MNKINKSRSYKVNQAFENMNDEIRRGRWSQMNHHIQWGFCVLH